MNGISCFIADLFTCLVHAHKAIMQRTSDAKPRNLEHGKDQEMLLQWLVIILSFSVFVLTVVVMALLFGRKRCQERKLRYMRGRQESDE